MLDRRITKKEFERIKNELKHKYVVNIYVYKNRPVFLGKEFVARTFVYNVKNGGQTIYIYKRKGYTELVVDMLHEIGHIIDYRRYHKSKRWKDIDLNTDSTVSTMNKKMKIFYIHIELMAEKNALAILKKMRIGDPQKHVFNSVLYLNNLICSINGHKKNYIKNRTKMPTMRELKGKII